MIIRRIDSLYSLSIFSCEGLDVEFVFAWRWVVLYFYVTSEILSPLQVKDKLEKRIIEKCYKDGLRCSRYVL